MASRKDVLAKIKALLAKTVANGCTEAEAFAALAKARAMMSAHEVTDADLTFGGEDVTRATRAVSDRDRVRSSLCHAVGRFTQCRSWTGPAFEQISFCGLDSDTVFAEWLLDMLADFVTRECVTFLERTWRPGLPRVRRLETRGFIAGCCERINQRLDDLADAAKPAAGRGLVIAKNALIDRFLSENGIVLQDARGRYQKADSSAYGAGEASGDKARFDRPIDDGRAAPLSIGVAGRPQ